MRQDRTTGQWVVISTERHARPITTPSVPPPSTPAAICPFCPGREDVTPPTIDAITHNGAWTARAFANRYPALGIEGQVGPLEARWPRLQGVGAHEVIVEAPSHQGPLHRLPLARTVDAMTLAQRRLADLRGDRRFAHICWFRNPGPGAAATQSHPHAQIIALPLVPPRVATLRACAEPALVDELAAPRKVWEGEQLAALCPWAPMWPFEVWLVPRSPGGVYADASEVLVRELAEAMYGVLAGLDRVLDGVDVNVSLHTQPRAEVAGPRWHLRLMPRLVGLGGFELATGCHLHPVPPEEAARELRAVL